MKAVLSRLTFRRLVLAVLPTVALTLGAWLAFGRDSEDRGKTEASRPAQTIPVSPPPGADDPLGIDAEPDVTAKPDGKAKKPAKRSSKDDLAADAGAQAAPPPAADPIADSGAAVRQAVTDTLGTVGYTGAKVDVAQGGRVVSVAVRRAQACDRDAPAGESLARRIRSGLPEVRTVKVTVAGSDQSLSDYRRSRCTAQRPAPEDDGPAEEPAGNGGTGRTVYSKRGSGPFTTPAFTIRARSWTVAYRNESDFFQAFVVKNGKIQPFVLNSDRRGSGSETFRGPGRFQLKINAAEGWSVTVRDGA